MTRLNLLAPLAATALAVSLAGCSTSISTPAAVTPSAHAATEETVETTETAETATVPDVVGMDGASAKAALMEAGFTTTFDAGEDSVWSPKNWVVVSQDVSGDSEPGSNVTLKVEKAEQPESSTTEALADEVWAAVLTNFPGGISTDSPLFAVTGVEDVSSGTIRVNVQQELDETGREEVARHVFNMGALDDTRLTTVVVRDASGIDSNHYRSDFPYLEQ